MNKIIGTVVVIAALTFLTLSSILYRKENLVTEEEKNNSPTPEATVSAQTDIVAPIKEEVEKIVRQAKKNPTIVSTVTVTPTPIVVPTEDNDPWGVSKQVGEHTWQIKLGEDPTMATAKEIFEALNEYRRVHGSQLLSWDDKLVNYAQTRANYLDSIKNVDGHDGFNNFVKNEDGFNKLGFNALGENISYGYKLNGTHIIEWMYAGDEPHDNNQLDNRWNYVGVGVKGLATCLIFGTGKF